MSDATPFQPQDPHIFPHASPGASGGDAPEQVDWTKLKSLAPYPPEAFQFVSEGLGHTVRMIHGHRDEARELSPDDQSRHINGQQLCLGLKNYAVQRYGLMARTVLHRWNIKRTEDFGKIVFAMVDLGLMRKTEEDTIQDFEGVFDFHEAFRSVSDVMRDGESASAGR
ncbi:MAG: hypothetical protein K2Y21_04855 [Phycisphaerales bacterium]|nr:hypothetical protein [Phycisphaerales bacterium]